MNIPVLTLSVVLTITLSVEYGLTEDKFRQEDASAWGSLQISVKIDDSAKRELAENRENKNLRINNENHGVQDVCVWMLFDVNPAIHADYLKIMKDPKVARIEQIGTRHRLTPQFALVPPDQTLSLVNATPILDVHVNIMPFINPEQHVVIRVGNPRTVSFKHVEFAPARVSFLGTEGYLMILNHPYIGLTDVRGELKINNIPKGFHKFGLFHANIGLIKSALIEGREVLSKSARFPIKVQSGENRFSVILRP